MAHTPRRQRTHVGDRGVRDATQAPEHHRETGGCPAAPGSARPATSRDSASAARTARIASRHILTTTLYTRLSEPKMKRVVSLFDGHDKAGGSRPSPEVENPEGERS
jgi:hypothetical protein